MVSTTQAYTVEEVTKHNHKSSCWVTYKGRVFDVTQFAEDHPGGAKIIFDYGGKDISDILHDPLSHSHSENALLILDEFLVGEIRQAGGGEDSLAHAGNYTYTDYTKDFKEEQFLDLSKPLLEQMFFNNFSKEFYLRQVHKPRYTKGSPRFMSSPILELFTRTSWYVVLIYWVPISCFFAHLAYLKMPLLQLVLLQFLGIFLFSLVEYVLHRFLFHLDDVVPDQPFFLFLHFLVHGVHHYIPMDKMRLVLPPALSTALGIPLIRLAYFLVPDYDICNALVSGFIIGYMCYDLMHYYIHHGHMFFDYFRMMKTYHMAHHHINYSQGFGVTSKLWDHYFGTVLDPNGPCIIDTKPSTPSKTKAT